VYSFSQKKSEYKVYSNFKASLDKFNLGLPHVQIPGIEETSDSLDQLPHVKIKKSIREERSRQDLHVP
jgi:hypothetical protein